MHSALFRKMVEQPEQGGNWRRVQKRYREADRANLFNMRGIVRLSGHRGVGRQLRTQAPLQFLAQIGNFHAGHDNELAGEHFADFIVIATHAAILAILVPAETAVRNGFRADELETAQQGIALGDLKLPTHDDDFNEFFVRTKRFRHDEALSFTQKWGRFPGAAESPVAQKD